MYLWTESYGSNILPVTFSLLTSPSPLFHPKNRPMINLLRIKRFRDYPWDFPVLMSCLLDNTKSLLGTFHIRLKWGDKIVVARRRHQQRLKWTLIGIVPSRKVQHWISGHRCMHSIRGIWSWICGRSGRAASLDAWFLQWFGIQPRRELIFEHLNIVTAHGGRNCICYPDAQTSGYNVAFEILSRIYKEYVDLEADRDF